MTLLLHGVQALQWKKREPLAQHQAVRGMSAQDPSESSQSAHDSGEYWYEVRCAEYCVKPCCGGASRARGRDMGLRPAVTGLEERECEGGLAHGGCPPEGEHEWELVEAARTHTVRRIDEGIWQEWELALPAACVAIERSCPALVPLCMVPSASMPHNTHDGQGSAPSI